MILTALLCLCSCLAQKHSQTSTRQEDTVDVRIVPVEQIEGLELEIGQNLSIPGLDIEVHRFSEKEVIVKTPIRREVRTETTLVPTRQVDKSRTYVNSKNRTKEVDKSRQNSGNKTRQVEKTKTVDKNINRFPWWIILLALLLGLLMWGWKNRGKLPFLRHLPF